MKKGVALIWVLVLSTVLLLVSTVMVDTIIKEARFGVNINSSNIAYSAARSGIEKGIKYLKDNSVATSVTFSNLKIKEATVTVVITNTGTNTYKIESTGTHNGVNRKLEYISNASDPQSFMCSTSIEETAIDKPITGNFEVGFNFGVSDYSRNVEAHLVEKATPNSDDINGLIVYYKNNGTIIPGLRYQNTAVPEGYTDIQIAGNPISIIDSDPAKNIDITDPYNLRIRLKYIEKTNLTVFVEKFNEATGTYTCIKYETYDLTNLQQYIKWTNLVYFHTFDSAIRTKNYNCVENYLTQTVSRTNYPNYFIYLLNARREN